MTLEIRTICQQSRSTHTKSFPAHVPCKRKHQDEESIVDGGCRIRRLESDNDHVSECARKHQEDPDEEEGAATAAMKVSGDYSVSLKTDGVVPAEEA